jgi:hypothetical protein
MPANAHAVPTAENPAKAAYDAKLRPSERFAHVPALRHGPKLRRLLGPSAYELWGVLQLRSFANGGRMITTTLRQLAGKRGSERTMCFALKRLADAHLIDKVKTNKGLALRVLSFDRDQWGNGEYSPYLSPRTLMWMCGRRGRGRPRKPPMPTPTQEPERKPLQLCPRLEPRPRSTPERIGVLRSYAFMPADPTPIVVRPPMVPPPPLLNPEDRAHTHREHLIELYASASRTYWPRMSVSRAVKFMQSRLGTTMLRHAAEAFIELQIPPALWIKNEFERVCKDRKNPMRPEVAYDVKRIERYGQNVLDDYDNLLRPLPDASEEFKPYREALGHLDGLYKLVDRRVHALPDVTDERAVRAVVDEVFPAGWQTTYDAARAKIQEINTTLKQRAERGMYLWGAVRG